jgi:hypothetical protein
MFKKSILFAVILLCMMSSSLEAKRRSFFAQGNVRVALNTGIVNSLNGNAPYMNVGAGFGYFFKKGIESGIQGNFLFGSNPNFYMVTGHVTAFWLSLSKTIKPYGGLFVRNLKAGGGKEFDHLEYLSVGARLGIYYVPRRSNFYMGGGIAGEHRLTCNSKDKDIKCDFLYPEIQMGFVF